MLAACSGLMVIASIAIVSSIPADRCLIDRAGRAGHHLRYATTLRRCIRGHADALLALVFDTRCATRAMMCAEMPRMRLRAVTAAALNACRRVSSIASAVL